MTRTIRRRPHGWLLACAGLLALAATLMIGAPPAQAAVACSFDESAGQVAVTIDGKEFPETDVARVKRGTGGEILVNDLACGAATVTNTDTISIVSASQYDQDSDGVVIDLSGGPLEPGRTAEPSGISEIEVVLALDQGSDRVAIVGDPGRNRMRAGSGDGSAANVNVNGDDDMDVTFAGMLEILSLSGGDAADELSGAGGLGTGSAFTGSLDLFGGAGDDALIGGSSATGLTGGDGDDLLQGGAGSTGFYQDSSADGADIIRAGANDFNYVDYSKRTNGVAVTLDGLANDGEAGEHDLVYGNVEVFGGSGNDLFVGNSAANSFFDWGGGDDTLYGGGGNDKLDGYTGDNVIYGGAGDDRLSARSGHDVLDGGVGVDKVNYVNSSSLTLTLGDGLANDGGPGENDLLRNIENAEWGGASKSMNTIVGNGADNMLTSHGASTDIIYGGAGNDVLTGGAGNDTLFGGAGDDLFDERHEPYPASENGSDTMSGGPGLDRVSYEGRGCSFQACPHAVSVTLADGLANDGEPTEYDLVRVDVENVEGGPGNDLLVGSDAANVLDGGPGNDTIFAGAGNDTLTGGAGSDSLFGSDGDDTFYAQDGLADTLNGGNGTDTAAEYDPLVDTLVGFP